MFGKTYTSTRGVLSPSKALRLFNLYMEDARRIDNDHEILMELCLDADFALSRIQQSRKNLASSASNGDKMLCQAVASAYYEVARLFGRLGRLNDAKKSDGKAEKWGYIQGSSIVRQESLRTHIPTNSNSNSNNNSNSNSNSSEQRSGGISIGKLKGAIKGAGTLKSHSPAVVPKDIFSHDVVQVKLEYNLPPPGAYLDDTQQLVNCLSLLPTAPIPKTNPSEQEQGWALAVLDDQDEQERLRNLASGVISTFIQDNIKAKAIVAEVVMLAPVLNQDQYRAVLMALVKGIGQNIMLEIHLLEGLAQLIQYASPGYLDSDDMVVILSNLSSRLQGTHGQSSGHIYQLCVTVSHVLDAMINNQVKGLKREQLHEPLAACLKGLKESSDPHLVYHAAYAFQALLYIPNDESTMQSMLRRASAVARGVFGLVSAVKELNLNAFMDELVNIQNGLPYVADIVDTSLDVYNGAVSLYESGTTFRECMEEGLSFSRKSAWYPALRGADSFLRTGELTKFKALVCEAPCRRDLAFQWGLCQRLGQIAVDTQWTMETRQGAIAFLGVIYKNDEDWGNRVEIKQWIITILKKLISLAKEDLQVAETLLADLAMEGDVNKQQLYKNWSQEPLTQYPFIVTPPPPASASLLDRVQNKSDVEKSLRLLKRRRMAARDDKQSFYIQQYAKATPQASDTDLFLLMDKVKGFLDSDQKVMLVRGDSGAGKSTFNQTLESTLWEAYQPKYGRIPLYINLPGIENPTKDIVAKQLRMYDFTEAQIKELKMTRSFILICDGYDEAMQTNNLYVSNDLNEPGEWACQMVISCRSEYLGIDYRDRFQPMDRNHQADTGLFQEAMIVPFSEGQVDDYIKQYVAAVDLLWHVEDYQRALKMVPSLQDLMKNPFILSLSLEVLPRMVDPHKDISKTQIRRVMLYDQFVELWLERGKKRLGEISASDKRMFRILCDEGFAQNGIRYLADLSVEIYKNQDGNPVVDYSPSKHKGTWKEEYFSRESEKYLLREASPMNRTGNQYRFVHRSILEYCVVRAMFEPQKVMNVIANDREIPAALTNRRQSFSSGFSFEAETNDVIEGEVNSADPDETSPLVWRSFINEPSILQFLEDRVRLEAKFKQQLYAYVELSKRDSKWRIAAANAMTVLVRAGEPFTEVDLRGIQIPGADLSHGIFERAQLQGADLRKVNFRNCWLREADLSDSRMTGAQFGGWPLLREKGEVFKGSYSPDGKTLAAAVYERQTKEGYVSIYDTLTWEKRTALKVNASEYNFIYSPDSRHIAIWHDSNTIPVYDTTSGAVVHSLEGHAGTVNCVVYSPSGDHLASASKDGLVHVWDASSGILQYTLEGHIGEVTSVVYSPDGKQLATGGEDKMVQLWDVASRKLMLKLQGSEFEIKNIVYSPNSQEIITRDLGPNSLNVWDARSGQKEWALKHEPPLMGAQYSPDGKFATSLGGFKAVQWNMQTKKDVYALTAHNGLITDLKYSPNGEQIATCAGDNTVRLWDARSGQQTNTFYGHSNIIRCLAYSPNSHQIASFSKDGTIRLWDTQPQEFNHGSYGHTKSVIHIRLSPNGQHIASCSRGGTVRVWDSWTGQCIHVLQRQAYAIKYSSDGQLLASCNRYSDARVCLWDTQLGQIAYILEPENQSDNILEFDTSPIDHQIVCGHKNGKVSVWDMQTGQLIRIQQRDGKCVECVAFSPSAHQIAAYDGIKIRVWATQSEELLYELKSTRLVGHYLAYSPDSQKIAFIQCLAKLQLRRAETGELCCATGFKNGPAKIAFSPFSRLVVIGSEKGPISVVNAESGAVLHMLQGHIGRIIAISFSCDGQYIASCSYDKTIRLWDPESSQCLDVIPFEGGCVLSLAWNVSHEGCFLVTGYDDGSIRVWQVTKREDGQCHTRLKWSTKQSALNADKTNIRGVVGLGEANRKLLGQHGATNDMEQRSTLQEGSHKAKQATSTQFRLKDMESEGLEMESKIDNPRAGPLIAQSEVTKGYRFICSKCSDCSECEVAHFILNGSSR